MPVRKSLSGNEFVETIPKKTSQGTGKHTFWWIYKQHRFPNKHSKK